ncbi:MAG: ATP-binding cassette domain-containing protein [Clostridiaceae bacterium]|nr:ATP-binding cassette domain-containing protein [Clostridiaceae bacterium]
MKQPQYKPVVKQTGKFSILIGVIFFLFLWQFLSLVVNNQILLPHPLTVLQALGKLIFEKSFRLGIISSLISIVGGFFIGLILGILLGHLAFFMNWSETFINPVIYILKSSPLAAITIILMIWIKTSVLPFALILIAIIPPIYYSTKSGLSGAATNLLEMAFVFRFKKRHTYRTIYLPALIKETLPSLDYTSGLAWKAGITGEIMAQPFSRIGTNLYNAKIRLESSQVLAHLTVILILSLLMNYLVKTIIRFFNNKNLLPLVEDAKQHLQDNCFSKIENEQQQSQSRHFPKVKDEQQKNIPNTVSIKNLNKSYKQQLVLNNLNCEIPKGLSTAIIGPSGQGKTTFFRILTGLEQQDSGTIDFSLNPVFSYAFQDIRLLENLTLSENLLLASGYTKNSSEAKMLLNYWEPIIMELDLPLSKKIHTFSGGMKQKSSLIRALAVNSNIIILDEVFREMDYESEKLCLKLLDKEKGNRTILLATHRQDLINSLADFIIQI